MRNSHEQLLVSQNTATCTGDKAGDGEAIGYDNNHNTFAFDSARTVAAASPNSVTVPGALQTVQEGKDISSVLSSYYIGHWVQIAQGRGLGQTRKVVSYSTDSGTGNVTFTVSPAWDVTPDSSSRIIVGREYWQVYTVDNFIDHRTPLCQKSNANAPRGGVIGLWAHTADSAVEGNRQYDTDGITMQQLYRADAPVVMLHTGVEIRGNVVDHEYDWNSPCSLAGFKGNIGASPTPASLPPVISHGLSVARNTFTEVDGLRSGALEMSLGWWGGPSPGGWRLVNNALIHHNEINDIIGPPPAGSCQNISHQGQVRAGINVFNAVAWRSVLYGNTCNNVTNPLIDNGTQTVRVCPDGATANSCECVGQPADLSVTSTVDKNSVAPDGEVTYTVTVSNTGTTSATDVSLSMDFTPGVEITAYQANGGCYVQVGTCNLGSIGPGQNATVTLTGRGVTVGNSLGTFSVTTKSGDDNLANNGSKVSVEVFP